MSRGIVLNPQNVLQPFDREPSQVIHAPGYVRDGRNLKAVV
jgi:hypothetical protein